MLKIKNLRGECQHCGKPIEFHADSIGGVADCPHCGQSTELLLALPPEECSPLRRKAIGFVLIALVILIAGIIGISLAFKRAQRLKGEQPAVSTISDQPGVNPVSPFASQQFGVSPVSIKREQGNSMLHAVGILTNLADRQRYEVKVELEYFDSAGTRLGVASDYLKIIEPKATWEFRALVVDRRASAVQVLAITETQ